MKGTSQTREEDISVAFEEECDDEVLLPKKENQLITEGNLTEEEFEANLNQCLSNLE